MNGYEKAQKADSQFMRIKRARTERWRWCATETSWPSRPGLANKRSTVETFETMAAGGRDASSLALAAEQRGGDLRHINSRLRTLTAGARDPELQALPGPPPTADSAYKFPSSASLMPYRPSALPFHQTYLLHEPLGQFTLSAG